MDVEVPMRKEVPEVAMTLLRSRALRNTAMRIPLLTLAVLITPRHGIQVNGHAS